MASTASIFKQQWDEVGYVTAPRLLPPEAVDTLRAACERALCHWRLCDPDTGKPRPDDSFLMRHVIRPEYHRGFEQQLAAMLDAMTDPAILEVAGAVLGGPVALATTSFFFSPLTHPRDGFWHRDAQFTAKDEADERQMIEGAVGQRSGALQLQIALVSSDDVELVPGSNARWDTPAEYEIRKGNGGKNCERNDMPGSQRFALGPGDAIAFNPYGLHRGRYHTDRYRRTLMLSYVTTLGEPQLNYFTHQPWFLEPAYDALLSPRARAGLGRFIDRYTPLWRDALAKGLRFDPT